MYSALISFNVLLMVVRAAKMWKSIACALYPVTLKELKKCGISLSAVMFHFPLEFELWLIQCYQLRQGEFQWNHSAQSIDTLFLILSVKE